MPQPLLGLDRRAMFNCCGGRRRQHQAGQHRRDRWGRLRGAACCRAPHCIAPWDLSGGAGDSEVRIYRAQLYNRECIASGHYKLSDPEGLLAERGCGEAIIHSMSSRCRCPLLCQGVERPFTLAWRCFIRDSQFMCVLGWADAIVNIYM